MTRQRLVCVCLLFFLPGLMLWRCGGDPVQEPTVEVAPTERSEAPADAGEEPSSPPDVSVKEQPPEERPPQETPPTEQPLPPDRPKPPVDPNRTAYTIPDGDWNETAVRRVLHVFAYGGFASDAQIKAWSAMKPEKAINEILSLHPHHPKLSPADSYDRLDKTDGTLAALRSLWASGSAANKTLSQERSRFKLSQWDALSRLWVAAATRRGLNPVRQRIGLWETNYHMAINRRTQVSNHQALHYYDTLMNALAAGKPYQDVLALASQSAAVATQYNHKDNVFRNGKFIGNEDFAREFFQLFFGILGTYDPDYHEFTTIRNMAKALTDMRVPYVSSPDGDHWATTVNFGTKDHYPGDLEILKTTIKGKTAKEKIQTLAQVAIQHKESRQNLPILIVRGLADDNLTAEKIAIIQKLWASLKTKDLLLFLKQYAISTAFHHPTRIKYWTSLGRNVLIHNLLAQGNQASYLKLYRLYRNLESERVYAFEPLHDVFGGQTGLEASESLDIFRDVYNRSTLLIPWITQAEYKQGNKVVWEKRWGNVLPKDADGTYRVKTVAEWLWQRFVADGLKNFGALERAHVYALLASGTDLGLWLDPQNPGRVYTKKELETDRYLVDRINDAGKARIDGLGSSNAKARKGANERIGLAVGFVIATPYMYAQQGK